jgi:hypothetical protein
VQIVGTSSTNVKVLGNRIGTNKNGASDFGNADDGVRIGNSSNTTIGGTSAGAGNVISGNDANGVFITGTSSATSNKVQGNFIGTDVSGTSRLGNGSDGVSILDAPSSLVGGDGIRGPQHHLRQRHTRRQDQRLGWGQQQDRRELYRDRRDRNGGPGQRLQRSGYP